MRTKDSENTEMSKDIRVPHLKGSVENTNKQMNKATKSAQDLHQKVSKAHDMGSNLEKKCKTTEER